MKKNKEILLGVLNITIQPHYPDKYIELFEDVFNAKKIKKYYGDKYGIISKLKNTSGEVLAPTLYGEISIFTEIEVNGSWFDLKSLDEVEERDLKEINIPERFRPNLSRCLFVFDATHHKLYFENKNSNGTYFGCKKIEKLFSSIFCDESIISKYGDVAVTLEPQENVLETLLSYPQINKIFIRVTPPNPDDLTEITSVWMNKLNNMQAKCYEETITSKSNSQTLVLDEATKQVANVASENGYVTVQGKDIENRKIKDSTKEHPKIIPIEYDIDRGIIGTLVNFIKTKVRR